MPMSKQYLRIFANNSARVTEWNNTLFGIRRNYSMFNIRFSESMLHCPVYLRHSKNTSQAMRKLNTFSAVLEGGGGGVGRGLHGKV